jgi:hypothetical protein
LTQCQELLGRQQGSLRTRAAAARICSLSTAMATGWVLLGPCRSFERHG